MLIESEYSDLLKFMFPGTWSKESAKPDRDKAVSSSPAVKDPPLGLSTSEAGQAAATADKAASQTHEVSCLHSAAGHIDGKAAPPGDPAKVADKQDALDKHVAEAPIRQSQVAQGQEDGDSLPNGRKEREGERESRPNGLSLAVTPGKANAV